MEANLIELASKCPDLMLNIKASDLIEASRILKEELLEELQTLRQEPPAVEETLLTREETMTKLGISSATIWRWKKCGYLVPVRIGSMDRYRPSDIREIIETKGGIYE